MIVDAHQHFWQVGRFEYPWMSPDVGVLYRDYLPPQLQPTLERNQVARTVLVQASNSVEESRWLLDLSDEYEFIGGVVGWVDLTNDNVGKQLDELATHAKFKGVRHLVESEPDNRWLLQQSVLHGLEKLAERGLSYDLLIHPKHLESALEVVRTVPDLQFVIDHLAKPRIAAEEFDEWSEKIGPFASFPNVFCKLSGLATEANWNTWTGADLQPYVNRALAVFGVNRLMFGSDHPVCLLAASYDRVLESFQETLAHLSDSERDKIFKTNATSFYRLD